MQVYRAEMPEFFGEKLTPRVKIPPKFYVLPYFIFTFCLFFLLVLGGMDKFNAICHTFSIVASGGFANHSSSVAQYQSPFLQWVMIIFMFLTGMNYAIHYQLLQGRFSVLFKDEELRFYFLYAAITTLIISICLMETTDYSGNALRNSAFHVVSIMSTTGLTTENYQAWPFLPQALLVTLMFIGGCGGSTSGGFKCMRVLLLLKCAYDEILMILHPRAVRHLKLGKISIPSDMLNSVCNYLIIFILITLLCALLLSAFGLDLLTSFSAALSCISCVGPAFGLPGADGNYSSFPGAAKVTLSIVMLLGRIEIYALLVLVMPAFWRD
jgi:Trk-type K+ transport systems, membrane components